MRRDALATALALVAPQLACSTLAEVQPPEGCVVDADCDPGDVCGDGVCYASELPARELLGLDVFGTGIGSSFRVEIRGDDAALLRINRSPIRYSVSLGNREDAPGVRDQLELTLTETYATADTTKTIDIAGSLSLSQQSRLGRGPIGSSVRRYLTDEVGMPLPDEPVVFKWARYDRDPLGKDIPLLLLATPDDGIDPDTTIDVHRGPIWRQLVRRQLEDGVGVHGFQIRSRRECHRRIHGSVIVGDGLAPSTPVDVKYSHAPRDPALGPICEEMPAEGSEAVCSPQTVATYDTLPECITVNDCPAPYGCQPTGEDDGSKRCGCAMDSQCPLGQVCELSSMRCALDLKDLVATRSNLATTPDDPGSYDAWIYTYCEDDLEGDHELDFVVTATPKSLDPSTTPPPLPTLSYRTQIDFPWGNGDAPPAEAKSMCLPNWAPPKGLKLAVTSAPRELYVDETRDLEWVCCTPACLAESGSPTGMPPPIPASCPLGATVSAYTVFTPDPETWKTANCMDLAVNDPALAPGSQRVAYGPFDRLKCGQADGACDIPLSSGVDGLEYAVRIEPPVGSLVRSVILPPQIVDAATTEIAAPTLEYRVLLRGRVALPIAVDATDSDGTTGGIVCEGICQVNAEVMAERLDVESEDRSAIPGPYFFTGQTIPGSVGEFVLPVNPGVYLLTALPQSGSLGGPAKIRVVDLRLASDLVDTSGPMPVADLSSQPIILDEGSLVTIELDSFDRTTTTAIPLDMAGWNGQIDGYPDLDLNSPATCYSAAVDRGCQIRRLRPGKSGLSPTQEQFVKYLTRTVPK